ncbi:antibiotic biosynthesis monooxygenase (plasmid) [Rhizobium sp. NIBRBAC000502774]|nr:antibiotic biosynthesis monooxygenase [Rhizobium sp. NIBRBAC000502774]
MIHEVASILIKPGMREQFEQSFALAVPLFKRAKGCKSIRLERSVEDPLRYLLVIGWETLEDHIVGFRNSDDYQHWRELVGGLFAAPPSVDHTEIVIE